MWHHTDACLGIPFLQRHLVVKFKRTHFDRLHFLDGEIQKDSLFDPLIDLPPSIRQGLGHTQLPFVQPLHDCSHSLLGACLCQLGPVGPCGFDRCAKCCDIHSAKVASGPALPWPPWDD